jgi:L,D-transpeptidase YcbB
MKRIAILAFLVSSLLLSPWPAACENPPDTAGILLQNWFKPLAGANARHANAPCSEPLAAVARFYRCRGYRPSWVDDTGPLPQTQILLQAIRSAPGDGLPMMNLNPGDPALDFSREVLFSAGHPSASDFTLARLDVSLTHMMLTYAGRLSQGRIRPEELSEAQPFPVPPTARDLPGELAEALDTHRLQQFLESLMPRHRAYHDLKKSLKRYRRIQAAGGWQPIPEGPVLKIGAQDARVVSLRQRLLSTGDLDISGWTVGDRFDTSLEAAVKRYQRRHGLVSDGAVGADTLASLNISVEKRITQLMLNMERWRWFPEDLGSRYIMVNIPGFELRLVENSAVALSMRAIVGRKKRPTPILTSRMTYLELNPYWNIPQKIARKDILPKIQDDPGYLVRKSIRVFDTWQADAPALNPLEIDWSALSEGYFPYRLQQQPAADNALGRIKFMFPNPQSVYIHDTPGKSLFGRPRRLFSSGCVRVEDPLTLAQHLLTDQNWTRRRLARAVASEQSRTIVLHPPVPVHLVYFTAWTDTDGQAQFRDDVYGHDRRLLLEFLTAESDSHLCRAETGPAVFPHM